MSDQTQSAPGSSASPQQQQLLLNALHSQIPSIYANGFGIISSASDLSLVMMINNNPVAVVSVAYTTAKSMMDDIAKALNQYERATKTKVKTINEIAEDLKTVLGESGVRKL